MGYILTIGEAVIDTLTASKRESDSQWGAEIDISVTPERHDNAPAWGNPTDHTNTLWPSYTAWYETAEVLNAPFMLNGRGSARDKWPYEDHIENFNLICSHPGHVILVRKHLELCLEAKERAETIVLRDGLIKGYAPEHILFNDEIPQKEKEELLNDYFPAYARIDWLCYWIEWALDNCETPIFCNS